MKTIIRVWGTLFVSLVLFTISSPAQPTPPPLPIAPPGRLLDIWDFSGTNFLSFRGSAPTFLTNVLLVPTWAGNGLQVDSTNAAWITYPVVKTNGHTNLSLASGTVETWFSPDWNSADGLGAWGTILEVGNWNTNLAATTGAWGLFISPDGSELFFSAQTNGVSTNYLNAPINWNAGDWHHLAITYSATNSALYLEGQFVTNGPGVTVIPDASVISNGFSIGSDGNDTGLLQARGVFNDLATYSDQLSAETISNDYAYDSENVYPLPSSGGRFHGDDAPPVPGGGGPGTNSGGVTFSPPVYDTNALWLEITKVLDGLVYLNLHNATNTVYEILSKTNLMATNWNIESEVFQTNTNTMPFIVPQLGRTNLYLCARDWTGITENGNTTPDWWFYKYFGTVALMDASLDSQGNTLLSDYLVNADPNVINFSISITNNYVSHSYAVLQLKIISGEPFYYAVMVDSTNFAAPDWTVYTSSNITASLGSMEGWHDLWVRLKGLPAEASPVWQYIRVKLDATPPLLVITEPTNSTFNVPVMQFQGCSPEVLDRISYDLTNAVGLWTNQPVTITGQFYSTNTLELTTNQFQAVDVPLASGTNIITLHAVDLAGNATTTNFTFVYDRSSRTNPPAVNLYWPQNGTLICNSAYTWRGWVDDPMATVSAQTIDTNGITNTFFGVVGRDGSFWVENIPFTGGTNWLMLSVTDSTGNVATTNITVSSSAVALTINPPTDDLWNKAVIVTGTINDTNDYTVWVNGVKAVLHGNGTWAATNVYLPEGGKAVIQARAIPDSDNGGNGTGGSGGGPVSLDNLGNPDPPGNLDTELQTDKPTEIIETSDIETSTEIDNYIPAGDLWTNILRTIWFRDAPYVTTYHVTANFPTINQTGWSDLVESFPAWPECTNSGDCDGTGIDIINFNGTLTTNLYSPFGPVQPGGGGNHIGNWVQVIGEMLYILTTSGQTTYTLHVGGAGVVFGQSLFQFSTTATTVNGVSIPSQNIQIAGEPIGSYVPLAANVTIDVTPVAAGDYSYTALGMQQYSLSHITDCIVGNDTNGVRTTIGIEELVHLSGMPTNTSWSASGSNYITTNLGSATDFFASTTPGAVTITATVPSKPSQSVTFNIVAPTNVIALSVLTNIGPLGASNGPPYNHIGAGTIYSIRLAPTNVSFANVDFRENIPPSDLRHWPDGEVSQAPSNMVFFLPTNGCLSKPIDIVTDGPFNLAQLSNGTNYVDFSYTRTWTNEYFNDAGQWIPFAVLNTTTQFRGSNQTCQETYQGMSGLPQGPWK